MTAPVRPAVAQYDRYAIPRPPLAEGSDRRLADAAGPRVPLFAMRPAGGEWPLHSFLELGALDGAVPSARLHARHVLREWGLGALVDSAELVVSELVTNGVQASRAMTHAAIRLRLASDRAQVVICVWDASPQPPVRVDATEDAEHGRGLLLVEAVSKRWGWFPAQPGNTQSRGAQADSQHGKVVWAIVSS